MSGTTKQFNQCLLLLLDKTSLHFACRGWLAFPLFPGNNLTLIDLSGCTVLVVQQAWQANHTREAKWCYWLARFASLRLLLHPRKFLASVQANAACCLSDRSAPRSKRRAWNENFTTQHTRLCYTYGYASISKH